MAEYDASICGCGCMLPRSIAHDPTQPFLVDSWTCHAGKYLSRKRRMDAEQAERTNAPEGWDEGKHYYVTPVEDARER